MSVLYWKEVITICLAAAFIKSSLSEKACQIRSNLYSNMAELVHDKINDSIKKWFPDHGKFCTKEC